jgi:hypothetical protein
LRLRSIASKALACVLVATPLSVAAQPENPAPEVDARRTRADELMAEGVRLRRDGQEREALALFQQSFALVPSPRARAQMALAMKSLRLYVEAEKELKAALSSPDDAWIAANRGTLEAALDFVDRQLAWLVVKAEPRGAELTLNGTSAGKVADDAKLRVPAGELSLELRAPGYQSRKLRVTAGAQRVTSVELVLPRAPLEPGARRALEAPPPAPRATAATRPLPPAAYVSGGIAILGVGIGSYLGLHALSLKSQRDEICPDPRCDDRDGVDLDERGRRAATWSTVSFSVGVAALIATGYLVLSRPSRPQAAFRPAR